MLPAICRRYIGSTGKHRQSLGGFFDRGNWSCSSLGFASARSIAACISIAGHTRIAHTQPLPKPVDARPQIQKLAGSLAGASLHGLGPFSEVRLHLCQWQQYNNGHMIVAPPVGDR
jgi:hypothetical protein